MSLKFAHGSIRWLAADAATTTYTVSGLDFRPKALRFYWMGLGNATDQASEAIHSRRGVGFATSTSDRRCVVTFDQDTAATSVCIAGYSTTAVAMTIEPTLSADGLLDLNAINSDGFQLIVDDQGVVDLVVCWEAWGGDDSISAITLEIAEPASTGTVDYECGLTPSVVMFAGVQATGAAPTIARFDSTLCVGFASGGQANSNVHVVGGSDDASATMDTDGYCQTGECISMITVAGGNPAARAQLTQFNPRGFRLNWITRAVTSRKYIALAIEGGQWAAGHYLINGNTGSATATVNGLPFTPLGVSLLGRMTTQNTVATSTADDRIGLGTGSSPTSRRSQGTLSENATASSVCEIDLVLEYDQVLAFPSTAGALLSAYDISTMLGDGFRIIVDTAGGVASEWQGYLTFGGRSSTVLNNYKHPASINGSGISLTEKIR